MRPDPSKQQLIVRSLFIAGGLTLFKLGVSWYTNSIAILASSADSLMDFLVSLVNFLFLKEASKPADQDHPYGHGKLESLAGVVQSLIIAAVTIGVAGGAIRRFTSPEPIRQPIAGIVVMVVALVFNLWHVRSLKNSMNKAKSQVIATEYIHFLSDTFIYAGIIGSLILNQLTGVVFWDPLISLLIVVYIVRSVALVFKDSLAELLDKQLPDEILKEIDEMIRTFHPHVIDYHDLRTRKVGETKFIEFHVVLRGVQRFDEAHDMTEGLIHRIRTKYPESVVTVHTDPEGGI